MTAASDWQTGAACASFDPGPWDPAPTREGPRQKERREQMALDVCNGRPADGDRAAIPACPIKAACLARAMDYGIWGGTTEAMRAKPMPLPGLACGDRAGSHLGVRRHRLAGEKRCNACRVFYNADAAGRRARQKAERLEAAS